MPAASSEGLISLEPELSRANDLASMAWFSPSVRAPDWDEIFVLTTIAFENGSNLQASVLFVQ
jgi:hypothetical protein